VLAVKPVNSIFGTLLTGMAVPSVSGSKLSGVSVYFTAQAVSPLLAVQERLALVAVSVTPSTIKSVGLRQFGRGCTVKSSNQ